MKEPPPIYLSQSEMAEIMNSQGPGQMLCCDFGPRFVRLQMGPQSTWALEKLLEIRLREKRLAKNLREGAFLS